ncbi:Ran-interacting Mog1 family protein [Theileria parva strain Muguga]|uniref:Ran-interacting Mog1 family protein n=1 Tax=Theileria parva strain Muguga TaxID=333668 RepID=UPI001C62156C|nr:Ran-interacting Mog1 family protein [Theileria parva strain Muguga]KAF5153557.1 Ran-interacting Mog1 family protein [Theileria parva strain Muguga]
MGSKEVKLYGGAITCQIPLLFEDLSQFLPVPDNQEVFVYHFNSSTNSSSNVTTHDFVLSFEILEYLHNHDDVTAGRKLFEDLASTNESRNTEIEYANPTQAVNLGLPETFATVSLTGTMEVTRSRTRTENFHKITVLMYDVRMPRYKCEFMVTYTYPVDSGVPISENKKIFEDILRTIRVVNTNLFST